MNWILNITSSTPVDRDPNITSSTPVDRDPQLFELPKNRLENTLAGFITNYNLI
jgi:hypothetical protein